MKIGGPPLTIFPETLDPPRNFGKNIRYPLPWIFNPCASMDLTGRVNTVAGSLSTDSLKLKDCELSSEQRNPS